MNLDLKINEFEGPLDLLLHLIKENKMDIFDIKIEKITEQYLEYIKSQESMRSEEHTV
jgi:segregation and condensation protein A